MAIFLADKSALSRLWTRAEVNEVVEPLLVAGEIASCGAVDLEILYSATGKAEYFNLASALRGMPRVAVKESEFDRALEVQALLAEKSQHRSVQLADLLIAAAAEANGLIVLHYDGDFDRTAKVTGQPTQWVVPRGSVS